MVALAPKFQTLTPALLNYLSRNFGPQKGGKAAPKKSGEEPSSGGWPIVRRVPTGPYLNNYLKSSACLLMLAAVRDRRCSATVAFLGRWVGSALLFLQMPAFHLRSFLEG